MRASAAAALSALALAGCATVATSPTLTRAQFIARADALCGAEQSKIERVAAAEHTSVLTTPRMIRHAVAIHEDVGAELEALTEPAGQQAPIARWLTARTVVTTIESDTAQALAKGLPSAAAVQRERQAAIARVRQIATAYGLQACATLQ